jgi:hypothetical protein
MADCMEAISKLVKYNLTYIEPSVGTWKEVFRVCIRDASAYREAAELAYLILSRSRQIVPISRAESLCAMCSDADVEKWMHIINEYECSCCCSDGSVTDSRQ